MSTLCAAKSLFLYYRKYLSEHICNRLLWEHIRRNPVHTRRSGGFTFSQQISRALQVASAHHPCHTPLQKTGSARLTSIFKISTHMAVAFPIASLVWLKGSVTSHTSAFPHYFPAASRQRYVFLPNLESGEYIWGECLPCSPPPHPVLLGAPGPPNTQPGILDVYEGPQHYKWLPSSWNYSSRANCNAMPRGNSNSWQIPSPAFRYSVSSALRLS